MSTPTYTFTPAPGFKREAMTHTSATEYIMAIHHYSKTRRPIYRFTLPIVPLTHAQMHSLSALHAYHQGATPFFFDGGDYGRVETYQIVDEGDGVKQTMYLPNRNIGISSLAIRTLRPVTGATSEWSSGYSFKPEIGSVTFNSAITSGDEVQAKYGCRYNVCFAPDGLKFDEIGSQVYRAELVLVENVLVGG